MNKELTAKCKSIEKTLVRDNSLDYSALIAEVDKNKHFRTDGQHLNAVHYFIEKGIVIKEDDKISKRNFDEADVEGGCDLDYVPNKGIEMNVDAAMSATFGFGGHNGAIIIKKVK